MYSDNSYWQVSGRRDRGVRPLFGSYKGTLKASSHATFSIYTLLQPTEVDDNITSPTVHQTALCEDEKRSPVVVEKHEITGQYNQQMEKLSDTVKEDVAMASHMSAQLKIEAASAASAGDKTTRDESMQDHTDENIKMATSAKDERINMEHDAGPKQPDGHRYKLTKMIGKGTYSSVYLSAAPKNVSAASASTYALKIIQRPNFQHLDQRYVDQKLIFENDATVLSSIQGHPNIVKLIEVIPEGQVNTSEGDTMNVDYAMVIECLRGGELSYNLNKYGRLSSDVAHYFFSQISDAIGFMHKCGFAHRDIKPWNVMLTDDLSAAKVIDFSYSTPLISRQRESVPANRILKGWLSGTPQFMAPEQLAKGRVPLTDDFSKMDVWALGVLLLNMLTCQFAFDNVSSSEGRCQYAKFMESPQAFFAHLDLDDGDLICLLRGMLCWDHKSRMSMNDVLQSDYVRRGSLLTEEHVRSYMASRLACDKTMEGSLQLNDQLNFPHNLPTFDHFSWQSTIIRHVAPPHLLSQLVQECYHSVLVQLTGAKNFTLEQQDEHSWLLNIKQAADCVDLPLNKDLQIILVFSVERDEQLLVKSTVSEMFRRKGDYLSFLNLYKYIWSNLVRTLS